MIRKRRNRRQKRMPGMIRELYFPISNIPGAMPLDLFTIESPEEPMYECCKGCSNWKGPMTICHCALPYFEMQRKGYGNFNNTVTTIGKRE